MTEKAKQALHTAHWVPVYFLVDGDAQDGYTIHYVDLDFGGWPMIKNDGRISTLYCVKRIIDEINTKGYPTDYASLLDMRSFAWHNHPIPIQPYQVGTQTNLSL